MKEPRFLEPEEFIKLRPLLIQAFNDREFVDNEYLGIECDKDGDKSSARIETIPKGKIGEIYHNEVAVVESEGGELISTAHIKYVNMIYEDGSSKKTPYICCVATLKKCRHLGYMDRVLNFVIDYLRKAGFESCFLLPVDLNIYRHLGFIHDFRINDREAELLYADDERICSMLMLNDLKVKLPTKIEKV